MVESNRIGVIAGGGQFPKLFMDAAQRAGREPVVIGFKGETSEEVVAAVDLSSWVKLGQLGKVIRFFKKNQVSEAVFLGTITKTRIFRDVFFDVKGLSLWKKIDKRNDDAILRAVAEVLEENGIKIVPSTTYLSELLFPSGVLSKNQPSKEQQRDIAFGWKVAKEIGRLDIGQCVVVKDRTVLAVEAIEGTDATILRGGEYGKEGAVVVKIHKPGQDFRFDLPATGVNTIATLHKVKGAVLAVEAGKSLLFDADHMLSEANRHGIVVVGISEDSNGNIIY